MFVQEIRNFSYERNLKEIHGTQKTIDRRRASDNSYSRCRVIMEQEKLKSNKYKEQTHIFINDEKDRWSNRRSG
jgi:hypothetical protein